jgi:hypothetical protein
MPRVGLEKREVESPIVFAEIPWSPNDYEQALSRLERGVDRPVVLDMISCAEVNRESRIGKARSCQTVHVSRVLQRIL